MQNSQDIFHFLVLVYIYEDTNTLALLNSTLYKSSNTFPAKCIVHSYFKVPATLHLHEVAGMSLVLDILIITKVCSVLFIITTIKHLHDSNNHSIFTSCKSRYDHTSFKSQPHLCLLQYIPPLCCVGEHGVCLVIMRVFLIHYTYCIKILLTK